MEQEDDGTKDIELSNQEKIRTLGEMELKILGNIGSRHHQTTSERRPVKAGVRNSQGEVQ